MIVTDLSNSFNPIPKNKSEKKKEVTEIKKKSKKLAKLERQRDKDIVKEGICEFCGKYSKRLDPHEVYGGSNRKRSIKHKFVKLICPKCHSNEAIINQLRIDTQKEYMKTHTEEEFINLIGKSYLRRNENEI
jgi:DNA-directed RNA polymerase subunit M/transcription elongation factor TFIIS